MNMTKNIIKNFFSNNNEDEQEEINKLRAQRNIKKVVDYLDEENYEGALEVSNFALMDAKDSEDRVALIFLRDVAAKEDETLTTLVVGAAYGDINMKNFEVKH